MITNRFIDKALADADLPISIDRSRCMRMRLNNNKCPLCTSNCNSGAITIDDDIVIDTDKCTRCMVCVSECPADCFDFKGDDFFTILARLKKMRNSVPYPVLGCMSGAGKDAHEQTMCLGALSDEHLIALNTFLDSPVQLNLMACGQCHNSFIIDKLKDQITDIRKTTAIDISEKVVLIEHGADLRFEAVAYDRRGFFSAVKNMTFRGASGLFQNCEGDSIQAYSQKGVPLKRDILNKTLRLITNKDIAARVLKEYAFTIEADASCDNCFSCVGMCPTGALRSRRDDSGTGLLFNPSMCIGCALCRDFCMRRSIAMLHGYSGERYFDHTICNKGSCSSDTAWDSGCQDASNEIYCHGEQAGL